MAVVIFDRTPLGVLVVMKFLDLAGLLARLKDAETEIEKLREKNTMHEHRDLSRLSDTGRLAAQRQAQQARRAERKAEAAAQPLPEDLTAVFPKTRKCHYGPKWKLHFIGQHGYAEWEKLPD